MNSFYELLRQHTPAVFNPRVTPDPTESERLAVKLQEATQRLNERLEKSLARRERRLQAQA